MSLSLRRAAPGHLVLGVDDVPHDLRFPATGNLDAIVVKILSAQEYPILQLPGWAPRTVLDIGANVGAASLLFSLAYPNARVRAWEPSPSTAAFLRDNTAWRSQIEVAPVGLHDRHASVNLYQGTSQCAQASVSASVETRGDSFETITLVPAAEAIGHVEGPVLLKIDTEGCEVPILANLPHVLAHTDVLFVEYHSEQDRRAIEALLAERFVLWRASAVAVHRGTLAYLSRPLVAAYPTLGALEIARPAWE